MFLSLRGLLRSSFAVSLAAYAAGVLLAGTVTALGAYRVVGTMLSELAPVEAHQRLAAGAPEQRQADPALKPSLVVLPQRQAFMTPLRAGLAGLPKSGLSVPGMVQPAFFGSSSRYWGRSTRRDRDEDDAGEEGHSRVADTYRTMCVRLCDGYYFPISFSATRDRFARDAKTCESSCGGQARLFVYRNPGADVEDMVDLRGQPYRRLSTAFLYRTEYVAQCRCKPNPWDAEAQERHRMYALAAAKRKGSKQAAAELDALTAKMKLDRSARPAQVATPAEVSATAVVETGQTPVADRPRRSDRSDDKTGRMGLGARTPREPRERPARSRGGDPDWMARALGRAS
jgi:Protein of unknown function (DUF2865)